MYMSCISSCQCWIGYLSGLGGDKGCPSQRDELEKSVKKKKYIEREEEHCPHKRN